MSWVDSAARPIKDSDTRHLTSRARGRDSGEFASLRHHPSGRVALD